MKQSLRGLIIAASISVNLLLIWYVGHLKTQLAAAERHIFVQSEIIRVNKDCDSLRVELRRGNIFE